MRSAPFVFWLQVDRAHLRDFCRLTHHHEDAYVGTLAVVLAIRASLHGQWTGAESLVDLLLPHLPDTRVRDRLVAIQALPGPPTIAQVTRLGTSGYVVDSVPFSAPRRPHGWGLVRCWPPSCGRVGIRIRRPPSRAK